MNELVAKDTTPKCTASACSQHSIASPCAHRAEWRPALACLILAAGVKGAAVWCITAASASLPSVASDCMSPTLIPAECRHSCDTHPCRVSHPTACPRASSAVVLTDGGAATAFAWASSAVAELKLSSAKTRRETWRGKDSRGGANVAASTLCSALACF